jgi:Abortive infection C-terminus
MARVELLLESAVHAQVGIRQGDVGGIGSFRTQGGSAHGRGRRTCEPLARHARLAIHASYPLVTFFLETWDVRKKKVVA